LIRPHRDQIATSSLDETLKEIVVDAQQISGMSWSFQTNGGRWVVPSSYLEEMQMVFLELIMNVLQHSQATRVMVTVDSTPDQAVITLQDDGKGIVNPSKRREPLWSVKRRTRSMGGELFYQNVPGGGTCVRVSFALAHSGGRYEPPNSIGDANLV
jgi:signal transduction histidine kinase